MREKKISIVDVAQASGVSVSTVSYALNGKRPIGYETRTHIIEVAKSIGYIPSNRFIAEKYGFIEGADKIQTKVIALSSPVHRYTDYTNYASFFFALAQRARQHGYDILLLMHEYGDEEIRRVVHNKMVDGILLLDVLMKDPRVKLAGSLPIPMVAVGYPEESADIWSVDLDFARIGKESVDRLYGLGHRNILLLCGTNAAFEDGSGYLLRYKESVVRRSKELGIHIIIHELKSFEKADIDQSLSSVFESRENITGILWQGSTTGVDILLHILNERNISVPKEISILSACTNGTVRLADPIDEFPMEPASVCKVAVDLLVDIIENGRSDRGFVKLLPGKFVGVGTSTEAIMN